MCQQIFDSFVVNRAKLFRSVYKKFSDALKAEVCLNINKVLLLKNMLITYLDIYIVYLEIVVGDWPKRCFYQCGLEEFNIR